MQFTAQIYTPKTYFPPSTLFLWFIPNCTTLSVKWIIKNTEHFQEISIKLKYLQKIKLYLKMPLVLTLLTIKIVKTSTITYKVAVEAFVEVKRAAFVRREWSGNVVAVLGSKICKKQMD